jgi:hypothetical protein
VADKKKPTTTTGTTVPANPLATGVPAPVTTPTLRPIGVPVTGAPNPAFNAGPQPGTRATRDPQGSSPQPPFITPQYFAGDELIGTNWPVEKIIATQTQLVRMGLLKRSGYQVGVWDGDTSKAYSELLGYANASGKNADAAAAEIQARVTQYGSPPTGSSRAAFTAQLTRPETLAQMAKELSVRVMDRQLTDEEAMRMATAYNQMEQAAQQSYYTQTGTADAPGSGGEVYQPGDFSSFANEQIKKEHPLEVSGQNLINNSNTFFDLLSASRSRYEQAAH